LTHARGVAAGPAFAAQAVFDTSTGTRTATRWLRGILFLVPSFIAGAIIILFSPNDHSNVLSQGNVMLSSIFFSVWYLVGNPFVPLLHVDGRTWTFVDFNVPELIALGVLKIAIAIAAVKWSTGKRRTSMIALIAMELTTAALMGVGRGAGDAVMSMSPRYQYGSLICNLPLLLAAGAGLLEKFRLPRKALCTFLSGSVVAISLLNLFLWKKILPPWVQWRGDGTRGVLNSQTNPQGRDLPGADFLTNENARELKKFYDLR
jgi:hypothetical protein